MLAITLCPQLVALVASSANPPPDGSSGPSSPRGRAIGMLPMLWLRPWPGHVRVYANMLLELLEGIVRTLRNPFETSRVEVRVGNMTVREEGGGRYGVVR